MILISTVRPHSEDAEYATNQRAAFASWLKVASKIIYLGEHEQDLSSNKTQFVPCEPFPKLSEAVKLAASQPKDDLVVILNADIILGDRMAWLDQAMKTQRIVAATSRRYTVSHSDFSAAKLTDSGLDVFAAWPVAWNLAAREMPAWLRFGHIQWDTWLVGFFNLKFPRNAADFTRWRCVFHPVHNRKNHPYQAMDRPSDRYIHAAQIPGRNLKLWASAV